MDDLIDLMVSNESPAEISDRIKDILMQKSAENIDIVRPTVANSIFGDQEADIESESEYEVETEDEYDSEEETDEEEESEE